MNQYSTVVLASDILRQTAVHILKQGIMMFIMRGY